MRCWYSSSLFDAVFQLNLVVKLRCNPASRPYSRANSAALWESSIKTMALTEVIPPFLKQTILLSVVVLFLPQSSALMMSIFVPVHVR